MKGLGPPLGAFAILRELAGVPSAKMSTKQHIAAAIGWIESAHQAAGDGGLSKGYSLLRGRWAPSYPETTGFTIPTLLNAAQFLNRDELRVLALSLADYLLRVSTAEGGVAHFRANSDPDPLVFDTGQVILGWIAAYEASKNDRYLQGAIRAADWITSVQDSSGSWENHQHLRSAKVIDTRVAWALLELYRYTQTDDYQVSAVRNINWALKHQDPDGWFQGCALVDGEDPLTHTLAYAAEGLAECGRLLREPLYEGAAQLTVDGLLLRQRADGSLPSTFTSQWKVTSRSSCLTGNCQMAILWLKRYETTEDEKYYDAAAKAIRFVVRTQNPSSSIPHIRGGIPGSHPIYGRYERLKYPNWAAKFFIDALLAYDEANHSVNTLRYVG